MGLLTYLRVVEQTLDSCLVKGEQLMALIDSFRAKLTEIDVETTRIGTKIQELVDKLTTGGLTEEQEAEVLSALNAHGERLKAIGTDTPTA